MPQRIGKVGLFLAALAGCGGTQSANPRDVGEAGPTGLRIVWQERSIDESAVELELWVDAGSRDARAPQTATLAAWSAATRDRLDVRVFPDGLRFRRACARQELPRCLEELRAAVSHRVPQDLEVLAERLRRARAEARGPGLALRRAALEALLGDAAEGFEPLGSAESDAAASGAVDSFLRRHLGCNRALLVLRGADPALEASAIHDAFDGCARAEQQRQDRQLEASSRTMPDDAGVAIAIANPEYQVVQAIAETANAFGADPALTGHAFPVRGGGIAILVPGDRAKELLVHLASYPLATAAPSVDVGARFIAGDEGAGPPVVAAVAPGSLALIAELGAEGMEGPRPRARNGATLFVESVDDAQAVLMVRPGSAGDPEHAHGRAAVAAESLALECGGFPVVTPGSWGVGVRAGDARRAAELVDCFARAGQVPPDVRRARGRAARRADEADAALERWIGEVLFPGAAGRVAPLGTRTGVLATPTGDVHRLLRPPPSTVELWWRSPTPSQTEVDALLARLGGLPAHDVNGSGDVPVAVTRGFSASPLALSAGPLPGPRAVIAFSAEAPATAASAAAARHFADALRVSLSRRFHIERSVAEVTSEGTVFAALVGRLDGELVDALPEITREALLRLPPASLDDAWAEALVDASRSWPPEQQRGAGSVDQAEEVFLRLVGSTPRFGVLRQR